ncbi:TIGR03086 family metal-binding protein [Streptomyces tremellae]
MSEKISDLLERAAARTVPVVRALDDEQLGLPTPCGAYDVRALAGHLYRVVITFQGLAAKEDADMGAGPLELTGDWRAGFAGEARALVAAGVRPGAEDGTAGAMGMPARTAGVMVLGDLVVHGWDLARATGRPYAYAQDDAVVEDVARQFAELAPLARSMGAFGPEVEVPPGAPALDRLLGVTGRDPGWRAPARSGGRARAGS